MNSLLILCAIACVIALAGARCATQMCYIACRDGFEVDDEGCAMCKCRGENPVCDTYPICTLMCQFGFEKDEEGCDVCKCAAGPNVYDDVSQ